MFKFIFKQKEPAYHGLGVIIIDMQPMFIDTKEKEDLVPCQIDLIKFCKEKKIPLIIFEYHHYGWTTERLTWEIYQLPRRLVHWFKKPVDDCFFEPRLQQVLRRNKVSKLIISGINAGACVYKTAKTAISKHYEVVTSGDLLAGYADVNEDKQRTWGVGPEWYPLNTHFMKSHNQIMNLC